MDKLVTMFFAAILTASMAAVPTHAAKPVDNDGDGYKSNVDCNDNDDTVWNLNCLGECAPEPPGGCSCTITENPEVSCADGVDNDCDGATDSADSDCATGGACADYTTKGECVGDPGCEWQGSPKNGTCVDVAGCTPTEDPETSCSDGVDNDCDGAIDGADSDCATGGPEMCKDGVDNDGDANIDCADSDCNGTPECTSTIPAHLTINSYNGPATCIACHTQAGNHVLNSVHGSWLGDTPDVVNISGPAGKWGASNNYCTDPELADYACLRCHVSLVGPPTQATAEDMDCLACHQNAYDATFVPSSPLQKTSCVDGSTKDYLIPVKEADGKYHKYPRYDLMPAGATMIEMARTVHLPNNESCLVICHTDAGGGDGIKRGDLDSAMVDPPVSLDVHLSSAGGAQMTCVACHAAINHQIPGRGNDLRPTDTGATMRQCVDCHVGMDSGSGHTSAGRRSEPDRHVARVACTACHISSYGDGVPTEMTRDWTAPKWSPGGCEGQGAWVGTTTKGSGVIPEYQFWTGQSWVYDRNGNEGLSPDPDDGTLRYSYPIGDINNGKLYPFKVHTSWNPVDNDTNMTSFDVLEMFMTGCYDDAARSGLDFIGESGAYTWKNTKAYQLITHGIGPATDASDCTKCHHGNNQFTLEFETKLDAIGYHLKDGDGNGVINDSDRLIICSQCHAAKSLKRDWVQMHNHTSKGSGIGCYFCHEFQRPERNLCDPCDPACVAEFVDTNPFPHQCP
jgi:hypothetical protein